MISSEREFSLKGLTRWEVATCVLFVFAAGRLLRTLPDHLWWLGAVLVWLSAGALTYLGGYPLKGSNAALAAVLAVLTALLVRWVY